MRKAFRTLVACVVCSSLFACAGAQLKSTWSDERGYSEADVNAIMSQYQEYNVLLARAQTQSNRFNTAPLQSAQSRLRAIYCTCHKRLGDQCRKKPQALSAEDKQLWIKANAVDMAFSSRHTALDGGSPDIVDPAECGSLAAN